MIQIRNAITFTIVSALLATSATAANPEQTIQANQNSTKRSAATQKRNRSTSFVNQDRVAVSEDSYSFSMTLPKRSSSQFTKLSFSFTKPEQDNEVAPIYLNSMETAAFVGNSDAPGAAIGIESTTIDETGTVLVEFNSPVPSNTPITVVFKPRKPLSAGLYQYSIAAYPTAQSYGAVFVGNGMLNIGR
ncbi:DUF2808 domain-containing protein [Phormidesmis sp. 146-33]